MHTSRILATSVEDVRLTNSNRLLGHLNVAPQRTVPWLLLTFLALVVAPSIAVIGYYTFVAVPQYAAEMRLVVRSADSVVTGDASATNMPIVAPPPVIGNQNAYVIAQYFRSHAVIEDLQKIMDLRERFSRTEADFWARLPKDASRERLIRYWASMTNAYVDAPSGIVTVHVRAFDPVDALDIARALILVGEHLVNEISVRARQDVMRMSEDDVRRAHTEVRLALRDLHAARDSEGIIDPIKTADQTARLVLELIKEKIRIQGELYRLRLSLDKTAPAIRLYASELENVDMQISALNKTLTSSSHDKGTVSAALRRFEELELRRQLAERQLSFAEESLERARVRAERQNLYLMVFAPPFLPVKATYPKRLANAILIPIAFAVLWGIGALLWASIEDHR